MGGLASAWLLGTGIVFWRQVHNQHHMPVPGALVGVTALFAALALISDAAPRARGVIALAAWGLDIAGLLNVLPAGLFGEAQTAQETSAQAEGQAANAG